MDNDVLIVLRQIESHLRDIKSDSESLRLRIIGVLTLLIGVIIAQLWKG